MARQVHSEPQYRQREEKQQPHTAQYSVHRIPGRPSQVVNFVQQVDKVGVRATLSEFESVPIQNEPYARRCLSRIVCYALD